MDEQLKSNVTSGKHWLRLVYMVVFAICLQVASFVMGVLVVLQFLFALIKGEDNDHLRQFGSSLAKYIYESLQFLTYNSEEKPFPFADWPEPDRFVQSDDLSYTDDVVVEDEYVAESDQADENYTRTDDVVEEEASEADPNKNREIDRVD